MRFPLFIVYSVLTALVVTDTVLALWFPVTYFKPVEKTESGQWENLWHQVSDLPGVAYEIVPDLGQSSNIKYSSEINSYGMRDNEPSPIDSNYACRVVIVGDSITYGFGVDADETFPNVLEELLKKSRQYPSVEVLNLGVGGYSSYDEAMVVKHKALQWNPNMIVIGYSLNDPNLRPESPLFQFHKEPEWWQYTNLTRLIVQYLHQRDIKILGGGDIIRYLYAKETDHWKSAVEAFKIIGNVAKPENIPVILVLFPLVLEEHWINYPYRALHEQVASAGRNAGFEIIDLLGPYSKLKAQSLMVRAGDAHPSKFGHELAAKQIFRAIQKTGLLSCGE